MKTYNEFFDYLDQQTLRTLMSRVEPKKEFIKVHGSEEVYDALQKSKVGYIKVHKVSDNSGIPQGKVYEGITGAFGEGLAVWISNPSSWFHTSTIESIDWENNTFKTVNSIYAFDFEEINFEELITTLMNLDTDSVARRFFIKTDDD